MYPLETGHSVPIPLMNQGTVSLSLWFKSYFAGSITRVWKAHLPQTAAKVDAQNGCWDEILFSAS